MSLEFYANQNNWPSTLDEAKDFAKKAVAEWDFKAKAPKFLAKIDQATTIKRVQELVLYSMLSGEGLGTIR